MVYLLDPSVPRVWRSPHALQFGVERPRLLLDPVSVADERMIGALSAGATRGALRLIARSAGGEPSAADALLERLRPVLERAVDPAPQSAAPVVVLDGAGPTAARILALLREAGVDARSGLAADDPALDGAAAAVVVGAFAIAPHRHQRWLRRDIPHLAVIFGDAGVTVGPFVRPGEGPCLRCIDLHRRDDDPAWPALAAQLHTRPAPGETELVCGAVASAAAAAVLAVLARRAQAARAEAAREEAAARPAHPRRARPERALAGPAPTVAARYEPARARWTEQRWEAHPECGCLTPFAQPPQPLAQPGRAEASERPSRGRARARSGIATADARTAVPVDSPAAPSSIAADAALA